MICRSLITLMQLSMIISLAAQGAQVVSVSPTNQRIDAPRSTAITIQFNKPIDPGSFNDTTFQVFGRWSGVSRGTVTMQSDSTLMVFQPHRPLFAGEWVSVQLSRHIRDGQGQQLEYGYAWGFWTACSQGNLRQSYVTSLVLRESGEVLLQTYGAHAGDLNADGKSDLIVINETADDLRVALNNGSGGYENIEVIPMGSSRPSPNDGGDFNKDSHLDLAIGSVSDDVLRICYGDGTGMFYQIDTYNAENAVRAVATGDFNGDGWDDIATANRVASNATIFLNQQDTTFSQNTFEAGGNGETSCAATDANGDGILDLFIGMYYSQEVCLLLGEGNGTFATGACTSVSGGPWMIASGDMNGDGHADVVSSNLNGDAVSVVLGDGEGGLSQEQPYFFDAHAGPLAIDLGDLDADGDLDAVASYYSSQSYVVFENDGSGTLGLGDALSPAESASARSSCAILHDRDDDGDLDITLTDEGDDVVYLYENEATVAIRQPNQTISELVISPNPMHDKTNISFSLEKGQDIRIALHSVEGALIQAVAAGYYEAGPHTVTFDSSHLTSGIYWLNVDCSGYRTVRRVVVQ